MTEKMKGSLALLLASVIWGSGFVAAKIGSGTMSFFSFNGMRFLAAVLILLPFAVRDIGRTGYFSQKENGYDWPGSAASELLREAWCAEFCWQGESTCSRRAWACAAQAAPDSLQSCM